VEGGESYKVCSACGKSERVPRSPGQEGKPPDNPFSAGGGDA
jgi:hypothetical protein